VRVFASTGLPRFGAGPVIGYSSAGICGAWLLLSPLVFSSAKSAIFGSLALTVVSSGLLSLVVLLLWPTEHKQDAFQRLFRDWGERLQRVEDLRPVAESAWSDYKTLQRQLVLYERLSIARQRHDQVSSLVTSVKYQLIHTDWRSLRGTGFESFLSRVFETLGYQVELTKVSGDQGVDLLVTGKGRRIAVQAKGYADSVGNDSVQEVVAGMAFYRCDSCAVVTNSRFTKPAESLAAVNHCRLIDGSRIPDLIEGRIY
jgi:hypothetical protein